MNEGEAESRAAASAVVRPHGSGVARYAPTENPPAAPARRKRLALASVPSVLFALIALIPLFAPFPALSPANALDAMFRDATAPYRAAPLTDLYPGRNLITGRENAVTDRDGLSWRHPGIESDVLADPDFDFRRPLLVSGSLFALVRPRARVGTAGGFDLVRVSAADAATRPDAGPGSGPGPGGANYRRLTSTSDLEDLSWHPGTSLITFRRGERLGWCRVEAGAGDIHTRGVYVGAFYAGKDPAFPPFFEPGSTAPVAVVLTTEGPITYRRDLRAQDDRFRRYGPRLLSSPVWDPEVGALQAIVPTATGPRLAWFDPLGRIERVRTDIAPVIPAVLPDRSGRFLVRDGAARADEVTPGGEADPARAGRVRPGEERLFFEDRTLHPLGVLREIPFPEPVHWLALATLPGSRHLVASAFRSRARTDLLLYDRIDRTFLSLARDLSSAGRFETDPRTLQVYVEAEDADGAGRIRRIDLRAILGAPLTAGPRRAAPRRPKSPRPPGSRRP